MGYKTQGGFTYGQVGCTAYNALRQALDGIDAMKRSMPDFADIDTDEQEAYSVTAQYIEEQLENWDGGSWREVAMRVYEFWRVNAGFSREWKDMSPNERAAWEALSRHIYNVIQLEIGEDLSEHEGRWAGYAEKQAPKHKE
jgi:hypothetical protein